MYHISCQPTSTCIYWKRKKIINIRKEFTGERKPKEFNHRAKMRCANAIKWLYISSKKKTVYSKKSKKYFMFKVNFITLTLSGKQSHTDKFIQCHMLQPFIKWMARKGASNYIWKAETQANGNIHFHITTNVFIHWKSIRNKWNALQRNFGYLTDYTTRFGGTDANSTDVHSVVNEKQCLKYLAGYVTKEKKDRRKVDCRIWSCNYELSRARIYLNEDHENFTKECISLRSQATEEFEPAFYLEILQHPFLNILEKIPTLKAQLNKVVAELNSKNIQQQKIIIE